MSRQTRGRGAYMSGLSAEATVARLYRERGGTIEAERHRTPEGEIDLVVRLGEILVFVEVKQRRSARDYGPPISARQWKRLEAAALSYMVEVQNVTGVQPLCRFDVALMGRDGSVEIIENARSFDEQ